MSLYLKENNCQCLVPMIECDLSSKNQTLKWDPKTKMFENHWPKGYTILESANLKRFRYKSALGHPYFRMLLCDHDRW